MRDRPCTTASQAEGRILSIYGGSLRCPSFHRQLQYLGFSGFLTDGLDLVCFQYFSTLRVNLSMFCCKGAAWDIRGRNRDSSFAMPAAFKPLTSIQNFKTGDVTTQIGTEHHPDCWKAMVGASHQNKVCAMSSICLRYNGKMTSNQILRSMKVRCEVQPQGKSMLNLRNRCLYLWFSVS